MYGREGAAEVSFAVAREFEARDHRVAEHALDKDLVRQSACEVLECCDYARVAYPQELAVVVKRIEKALDAPVHLVEAFALGKLETAPVAFPRSHLGTRDCRELLAFPGAEVDFHEAVVLLDRKAGRFGNFFGEAHAADERAREESRRVRGCLQEVFDGARGFLGEGVGNIEVEPSVADVLRVVGFRMANGPEYHGRQ